MGLEYHSQDDVRMRLEGTICWYEDHPYLIMVQGVTNPKHVKIFPIDNKGSNRSEGRLVDYTSDSFDYTPRATGFVNIFEDAYHVLRVPHRIQKQGMTWEHLEVTCGLERIGSSDIFRRRAFEDMLLNKYPSFDQALNSVVVKGNRACAMSRNFCVRHREGMYTIDFRKYPLFSSRNGRDFSPIPGGKGNDYIIDIMKKEGVELSWLK